MNNSGLHPLGRAVLCEPYVTPAEQRSKIVIPEAAKERGMMVEVIFRILELGPNVWPDEPPRAKIGDLVMLSKFGGATARGPLDGKLYRLANCDDVYCGVEEKSDG